MDAIDKDALIGLPNLERAERLAHLLDQHNLQQKDLARHIGISADKMSRFLMPTKLSEPVKRRIRSSPPEKRPSLGCVELLCRLTPELQQEFVEVLPLHLPERKQMLWLKRAFIDRGIVLSRRRYRRKYRLGDHDRIIFHLGGLAKRIRRINEKIRSMTPEGRIRALAFDAHPEMLLTLLENADALAGELLDLKALVSPFSPRPELEPKRPVFKRNHAVTVMVWDERILRFTLTSVALAEYVRLWDRGFLKFQREKTAMPAYLPTREEASALL